MSPSAMSRYSWSSKGVGCVAILVVAVAVARAATPKGSTPFVPEFEFSAPLPSVVAAAAKHEIATGGIARARSNGTGLIVGDQVTALVTLMDGKKLTQWLVEMTGVELSAEEKQKPPLRTWTLHTNTGTEVNLSATRAVLAVRVLGPFAPGGRDDPNKIPLQHARVMVNADFLSLGLDRACEAVMAVNAAKLADPTLEPLNWSLRQQPFPASETEPLRRRADALGLTPERERAQAGSIPALQEFFGIISRTPGLQDILKSVIDVPWWKVISQGGNVSIGIMPQYRAAERIATRGAHPAANDVDALYTVPVQLSIAGQAALIGKLALVNPRPPLLACAGIIGIAGCAPDGKGPRVMLQVIATRPGETASAQKL